MKVFIDPGHGGRDYGAGFRPARGSVGPILLEKEIVLGVAKVLLALLVEHGQKVGLSRTKDDTMDLLTRVEMANRWGADVFVSIHTNADRDPDGPGDPEAKGSEIWIYPKSKEGRRLAESIKDQLPVYFPGRRFRGIKERAFYVLKYTRMPAVLLELAFIDTVDSSKLVMPEIQVRAAETIAAGLNDYIKESRFI